MDDEKKETGGQNPENLQNTEQQEKGTDDQDYAFLKEVIKKKPLDKRKIGLTAAGVVGAAVLFGIIAAFTFTRVLPLMQTEEETQDRVNMPNVADTEDTADGSTETDAAVADGTDSGSGTNDTGEGAVTDGADAAQGDEAEPESTKTGDSGTDSVKDDENGTDSTETDETGKEEVDESEETSANIENFYAEAMEAAEEPQKSLVTVQGITNGVDWMNNSYENSSQMSGLLVAEGSSDYYILTEYRVVDQVDRILVTFCDDTVVDARFQKRDQATGLAVLKLSKDDVSKETKAEITVAVLGDSSSLAQGDPVLALGSPSGYGNAVSYGMVTSVKNKKTTLDNEYHVLTTDIMGSPEGSGVIVSLDGQIQGIILQSFSLESDKNAVTALPVTELRSLVEQLANNEELTYFGVRGQDIESELSDKTGIPKGIYVNSVEEDSPAMVAGVQNGDVIIKIDDDAVETLSRLRTVLNKKGKDDKITVTVMRKGTEGYVEIDFEVTLDAY